MNKKILAMVAVAVLSGPVAANAAPINWSVDSLTLTDGSTVSGGFAYDASLDAVSNIHITLTDASNPGSPYTLANQFYPTLGGTFFLFNQFAAADYTGQATLWITVTTALTDAGNTTPINTANGYGWGFCSVPGCTSASNPGDLQGSLVAVPEAGSLALFGLGLLGLGFASRRRVTR
jgi:hypothetical protein